MLKRLALVAAFACLPAAHAALPESVSAVLGAAKIPDDAMSVLVLRGDTTLVAQHPERPMQPASTMKLVTTLIALEQLGPVFRSRTELRSSAEPVKGTLEGELFLRGGADADFNADALTHMLETLRQHGIRKLKGNLVLDRGLFQPPRPDLGVPPFDESPEFRYNVIPDALLLNMNLVDVELSATDKRLNLTMLPEMDRVSIGSDMTLSDAKCADWEDGWKLPTVARSWGGKLKITLHGSYPRNCVQATSINVLDRQDYIDRLFRATWRKLGGQWIGETVSGATPADSRLLAEHLARALPEVVRDTNKVSDNTLARALYLSLGSLAPDPILGSAPQAVAEGAPTAARSEQVVRAWMQAHHIDDQGLVLENGSGLSRTERISPNQMAGLLLAAEHSLWAPEFQASMPIVGVDGTMRRRLKDSPAAAHARLKTGTLRNVVAVAGYVPDADGTPCVVVAMINDDLVGGGAGRKALDTLVDWVAHSSAGLPLPVPTQDAGSAH